MKLRVRHLRLRARTAEGVFGCDLQFGDGLNVLHAPNTTGKSMCAKAIVYALGLERFFGPEGRSPLPPALTHHLEYRGQEYEVAESDVELTIENSSGDLVTLQRQIAGESQDWRLVRVRDSRIADDQSDSTNLFYVRDPGSAVREKGFHDFLARFVGWELPQLVKYDGNKCPLYMELLLPLFYVEQSTGWSAIQATTPRYYQIRDVDKRSFEYLSGLHALSHEERKQELLQMKAEVNSQWRQLLSEGEFIATRVDGVLRGFGTEPGRAISDGEEWQPYIEMPEESSVTGTVRLESAISAWEKELRTLRGEEIPRLEDQKKQITSALERTLSEARQMEQGWRKLDESLALDSAQLEGIGVRLESIEIDLQRHLDIAKLATYSGEEPSLPEIQQCPTCGQEMVDTVLPYHSDRVVMTVEENIAFLKGQRATLLSMRQSLQNQVERGERQRRIATQRISEKSLEVQSLRQTLFSDTRLPSQYAVQRRVTLEARLAAALRAQEGLERLANRATDVMNRWREIVDELDKLPDTLLDEHDVKTLRRFREILVEQLRAFEFSSFSAEAIQISRANYRPVRDGFRLEHDVSASDSIRVIAAYHISLLELAREHPSAHPGFLMLDEPRQQNLRLASFESIFQRVADSREHGQQVLLLASGEEQLVRGILSGLEGAHLISFGDRLLQPIA